MTVLASAAILGLAWFAALNLAGSALAAAASRWFGDEPLADARRARRLLAVRFAPIVASAIVAGGFFVPAHVQLEPVRTDERYGVLLLAFAALGVLLLGRSIWRAWTVLAASRTLDALTRRAGPAASAAWVELPMMRGIALAGVLRPRILVGAGARQALTTGELDVALAHERAHRHALDNLTRVLMVCVPDVLGFTAAGRRLEQLWGAEAECLADARAAAGSRERAGRLASALVKIAKLKAPREQPSLAWSPFHQPRLLEARVRLLLDPGVPPPSSNPSRAALLLFILALGAGWLIGMPASLHSLTELAIAILP